jgi:phospholipid N-methyltransferase
MGRGVKIPKLIEILAGYGVATDELLRRIDELQAKFPAGEVPLEFVEKLVRQFVDNTVVNAVIAGVTESLMDAIKTGKSLIREDDSAAA